MAPNLLKKVKSKAKDLVKKAVNAVLASNDTNNKNKKSSHEAVRGSPLVSPAIPVRTPSEKRDIKERAKLPCTSPAQEPFPIDD